MEHIVIRSVQYVGMFALMTSLSSTFCVMEKKRKVTVSSICKTFQHVIGVVSIFNVSTVVCCTLYFYRSLITPLYLMSITLFSI